MVAKLLKSKGYKLKLIDQRSEKTINQTKKEDSLASLETVESISMFLKPEQQKKYYDYILSLKPKSIIFNPGTENPELESLANQHNIKIISCCTIAMLAIGVL